MKILITAAVVLLAFLEGVFCAGEPGGLQDQAGFFAALPFPDSNPLKWQLSPTAREKAIQILGIDGDIIRHSPKDMEQTAELDTAVTTEGKPPPVGRGHGGMTYVNWKFGLKRLADLSMDITFHTEPQPPAAVFLQLYDFKIGDTNQYFGFQYAFGENGKLSTKFIWSRWDTRDKADARPAEGAEIVSSGHEGDFVSVRYPYSFGKGTYTVHVMMRETDSIGTWYEMGIYDHQKKVWTKIGRLRFPMTASGLPFVMDGGGSWCEVFGGTRSSRDIGLFHLSYDGVYTCGRTIVAREAFSSYGKDTPNCDICIDPDKRRVHVKFGGETGRVNPAGKYDINRTGE